VNFGITTIQTNLLHLFMLPFVMRSSLV